MGIRNSIDRKEKCEFEHVVVKYLLYVRKYQIQT